MTLAVRQSWVQRVPLTGRLDGGGEADERATTPLTTALRAAAIRQHASGESGMPDIDKITATAEALLVAKPPPGRVRGDAGQGYWGEDSGTVDLGGPLRVWPGNRPISPIYHTRYLAYRLATRPNYTFPTGTNVENRCATTRHAEALQVGPDLVAVLTRCVFL